MNARAQFSSKLGFVMAAAGSAIGVGNIWGFPTQAASNGGGAFLLMYLLMILLLGYPMLVAEITIGRHGQAGPFHALQKLTKGPGRAIAGLVGLAAVLTVSLIFTFTPLSRAGLSPTPWSRSPACWDRMPPPPGSPAFPPLATWCLPWPSPCSAFMS
ncbi:hypothetical protein MBH78_05560 [Oceanimonas sp. NS1]|nr:hypothetical protein [Oceanimonas sp. NS1]